MELKNLLSSAQVAILENPAAVAYRGGVWGVQTPPPRNSEVLTQLHLIAN